MCPVKVGNRGSAGQFVMGAVLRGAGPGGRIGASRRLTSGGGCVSRGHAEVTVDGMRAAVTPYDIRTLRAVCPSDIAFFEHTATVRFDAAGTAEVVVEGLRQPDDEPVSVRRTVIVRGPAGGEAAGWSHGH
jgi:hypothetical protein